MKISTDEDLKQSEDRSELSTGRMDPRVGSGRVGSGRVTILLDFGGSGRVGSALRIY